VRVLVADRDARVRRALSGLFEAAGAHVVGATSTARLIPNLDARLLPDLVILELDPRRDPADLAVVAELVHRGRTVIVVCSRTTDRSAALAAGAAACLEKDARFADRLAEVVPAVTTNPATSPPT
jgi:DNA-binding NarL/FixJ family response regulator